MAALGFFVVGLSIAGAFLSALLAAPQAQNRVSALQSKFQSETDPVRKAKALPKLGDAQFEAVQRETAAGNYAEALRTVEEYCGEVNAAYAALKASGVDAERKPSGFKQLEIHLRRSLRRLDDIILVLPAGSREPFEALRSDLQAVENELVHLLFPRRPPKLPETQKPKE